MTLDSIPLFSMIRGKLDHVTQRERLIAQNVANADTPGYMPTDLKPFAVASTGPSVGRLGGIAPVRTNAMHLEGEPAKAADPGAVDTPDSETTLTGNHVVLEEEMMKMTEARIDYEAAVSFYEKSLDMLKTAARAPGR